MQENSLAAELPDADLERDACACGSLAEKSWPIPGRPAACVYELGVQI